MLFLSCKAKARVKLAKTWHGTHSSTLVVICVFRLLFVLFCALFVCKCVLPPGDNPIAVNKYIISCGRKWPFNPLKYFMNCISCDLSKYSQNPIQRFPPRKSTALQTPPHIAAGEQDGAISGRSTYIHQMPVTKNVHISGKTVRVMRRMTTFRPTTGRMHDGNPIIL